MIEVAEAQSKLCEILKSVQKGDFSTFKWACDLAGLKPLNNDKYFHSNQFFAAQIGGILEVSALDASTRWWIAFKDNIVISSEKPKAIGTSEGWFRENRRPLKSLIEDGYGQCLLVGVDQGIPTSNSFGSNFSLKLPSLIEIEKEVLREESFFFSQNKNYETFNLTNLKWELDTTIHGESKSLVRVRKKYGGFEHFLISEELGIAFRVLNPEWAFFLAGQIFDWDWMSCIQKSQNRIAIPRQIRFPNFLLRFLFANSQSCRVGTFVEFIDADSNVANEFVRYLSRNGAIYEI
ncbi:hypothetical protein [Bdellovibrio sp.]|uniref:hypothetical protein n=1 Tax=Bdellovibrio sp. TaxID=28201 RepID=UPI0039E54DF5